YALTFAPSGKELVCASPDSLARVDLATGNITVLRPPPANEATPPENPYVPFLALLDGGGQVVVGIQERKNARIQIRDVSTGRTVREVALPGKVPVRYVLEAGGRRLIVVDGQGNPHRLDLPELRWQATGDAKGAGRPSAAAVSSDGRWLCT